MNHVIPGSRELKIGILTVSDRCSAGEQEDKSGPNLKYLTQTHFHKLGAVRVMTDVVPDDQLTIKNCLLNWVDVEKCILVLTTGRRNYPFYISSLLKHIFSPSYGGPPQ